MKSIAVILLGLALAQAPAVGKVDSTFDKNANFTAFKTYAWSGGTRAFNPAADKIIAAAVEAEMSKLGLTKVASGADVGLSYHTTTVTNVDFEALEKLERAKSAESAATRILGKLVVNVKDPASGRSLWSASTREYLDPDIAKLAESVGAVAARLFETYPKRQP